MSESAFFKPIFHPLGAIFRNESQWQNALALMNNGHYPCQVCGKMRSSLFRVPRRYMPFIGHFQLPEVIYACSYCISDCANAKRDKELAECGLCRQKFRREDLIFGIRRVLEPYGLAHHVWVNLVLDSFLLSYETGPDLLGLGLIDRRHYTQFCRVCSSQIVEFVKHYRSTRDKRRSFESAKKMALAREEHPNDYDVLIFDEWEKTLKFFNGSCAYCSGEHQARDHFFPVSKGGRFTTGNILPSCVSCNSSKRDRDPIEWMTENVSPARMYKVLLWIQMHNDSTLLGANNGGEI